jgi:ClpX C4-type zinc finger
VTEVLCCSFCLKRQEDVTKLIAGPTVFICDECVAICVDILADDARVQSRDSNPREPRSTRPLVSQPGECSLCHTPTDQEGLLAIENRGSLCGGCADAVEDALARGTRLDQSAPREPTG